MDLRRCLALAVVPLVALLAPATALGATVDGDRLALTRSDLGGLVAKRADARAARRALRALVPGVSPRQVDASAFAAGSGSRRIRLVVQAFALSTPGAATRAIARWQAMESHLRHHPRRIAAGDRGVLVSTRTGTDVALRVGRGLALLHLEGPSRTALRRTLALGYAAAEVDRLGRVLARTAWDRAVEGIRRDGTVPLATSLQMFSLVYDAPIAGVRLPPGSRRTPGVSGTTILERVLGAWPSLSPAQRADVERGLRVRAAGTAGAVSPSRFVRRSQPSDCSGSTSGYPLDVAGTVDATRFRDAIAAHIGMQPAPSWLVCVYDVAGGAGGFADTFWAKSGALGDPLFLPLPPIGERNECYMRAFDALRGLSAANRLTVIAHEAYHCVHFEQRARQSAGSQEPPANAQWIEDGLATWAANQVAPGSYEPHAKAPGLYYWGWLTRPRTSWFSYSYEAFGLIGEVESQGSAGLVWQAIPQVWAAGQDSFGAYHALVGAAEPALLDDAGADLFRLDGLPSGWHQRLPFDISGGPAGTPTPRRLLTVAPTAADAVGSHQTGLYEIVAADYPLIRVDVNGYGKLTDGTTTWRRPRALWLCLGGNCACPSGQRQHKQIPDHVDVEAGARLFAGIASGDVSSSIATQGHAMDEYCGGELSGTWTGTWASTRYPLAGGFSLDLTQTGTGFDGTITVSGSPCITGGTVTGTVKGKTITFGVVDAGKIVNYTGTLSGSTMAGAFASAACGSDAGRWKAAKD